MPSQSLARIMYGTSREYAVSADKNVSTLSTLSEPESAEKNDAEPESLGELLLRAWTNFSRKP
jgi:hypothetical protein